MCNNKGPQMQVSGLLSELLINAKHVPKSYETSCNDNNNLYKIVLKKICEENYLSAAEFAAKLTDEKKSKSLSFLYRKAINNKDIELLSSVCDKLKIQKPLDFICGIFKENMQSDKSACKTDWILSFLDNPEKYYILHKILKEESEKDAADFNGNVAILIFNLHNDIVLLNKTNEKQEVDSSNKPNNQKPGNPGGNGNFRKNNP